MRMLIEQVMPNLQAEFPNIELNIVGDGRNSALVQEAADRHNKDSAKLNVTCLGFQSEPENYLADAALVMGVGRVAAQALSRAVPVLSLNNRHLGPLVSRSNYSELMQNNFVHINAKPPMPTELTTVLTSFLRDPAKWKKESIKLQAIVQKDLSTNLCMRQTLNIYQDAIHEMQDDNTPLISKGADPILNSPTFSIKVLQR